MLIVVDLGTSNLSGVCHALVKSGGDYELTDDPEVIAEERTLVLPWMGPLTVAMDSMRELGIDEALREAASTGATILCLGSGMLLAAEEIAPGVPGLGLLPGKVAPSPLSVDPSRVRPLVGWAPLDILKREPLFKEVADNSYVYYLVSQVLDIGDPNARLADARLGAVRIAAAARQGNVYGLLFEADKSGEVGLRMLHNFLSQTSAVSGRIPRFVPELRPGGSSDSGSSAGSTDSQL